jgi:hypothetical protein
MCGKVCRRRMHKKECNFGDCVSWINLVQNRTFGGLFGILELQNKREIS